MSLMSGELSGLSGSFLMMTATATPATRRILQSQIPEIKKWTNLLSPPLRTNVQILIPPPDSISSKVEVILAPFIQDMRLNNTTYLIIVRGTIVVWISFCYAEAVFCKVSTRVQWYFYTCWKPLRRFIKLFDLSLSITETLQSQGRKRFFKT